MGLGVALLLISVAPFAAETIILIALNFGPLPLLHPWIVRNIGRDAGVVHRCKNWYWDTSGLCCRWFAASGWTRHPFQTFAPDEFCVSISPYLSRVNPVLKSTAAMDETTKIYRERVMNMRKTSVKKNTKTSTKTSEPATSLAEATPEERWKMVAVSATTRQKKEGFLQLTSCRTGARQKRK